VKVAVSVSDAESRVLEVLWRSGHSTSERVIAALSEENWEVSTIKTLLARLVKKRAIRARKEGRRYVYSALLTREQWVTTESEGLLDRVFGGRVAPFVQHFSQHRRLSKTDIAELKRLIEELDDGQ
jgi:BlaI family transcriptional regulator, penicillinase repressor